MKIFDRYASSVTDDTAEYERASLLLDSIGFLITIERKKQRWSILCCDVFENIYDGIKIIKDMNDARGIKIGIYKVERIQGYFSPKQENSILSHSIGAVIMRVVVEIYRSFCGLLR